MQTVQLFDVDVITDVSLANHTLSASQLLSIFLCFDFFGSFPNRLTGQMVTIYHLRQYLPRLQKHDCALSITIPSQVRTRSWPTSVVTEHRVVPHWRRWQDGYCVEDRRHYAPCLQQTSMHHYFHQGGNEFRSVCVCASVGWFKKFWTILDKR